MSAVFLVTSGDYSDYHICAAFSDEESANKYAEKLNHRQSYDRASVEIWELDNVNLEYLNNNLYPYRVMIWKANAEARNIYEWQHPFPEDWNSYEDETADWYIFYIYAESEQHAAKIAMERRSAKILESDLKSNELHSEGDLNSELHTE